MKRTIDTNDVKANIIHRMKRWNDSLESNRSMYERDIISEGAYRNKIVDMRDMIQEVFRTIRDLELLDEEDIEALEEMVRF